MVGLGLVAVFGVRAADRFLRDYASHQATFVTLDDVELVNAPRWMTRSAREQIAGCIVRRLGIDPMDGRDLAVAAAALGEQPWVRQVYQVRRIQGGRIRVNVEYRVPAALVQGRHGYHLVDAESTCLPGLYLSHQVQRMGLPVITGVGTTPPARPGDQWPGEDLSAALQLVQLLANEAYANQIRRYDVGGRDRRGRIRLVLHTDGGMVRWGLPPGQEQAIEPNATTKVAWLRHVDAQRGSIDAGGKIVDLYGPRIAIDQAALWAGEGP